MWGYIVQGLGYGLTAAAQPGPFQTYVISQTMRKGWRRALPMALAPLVSDGPIIALVLLLLSQVPSSLEHVLYMVSGVFILYLAVNAFFAWRNFDAEDATPSGETPRSLFHAALMNALSPGPYIYWSMVTGPILLDGWREAPVRGIGFMGGFYAALVGSMGALILVFGSARRLGAKVERGLLGVSTVALVGFGLYQLWRGIGGWVIG